MDLEKIIPCLFPFFFVPLWIIVVFILANLGGWARLAQHYEARATFAGKKWGFKSGRVGIVNYNGCLTLGANDEGLYLAVLPLFRVGHPPLFIPWYDITTAKSRKFLFAYVDFRFARNPAITFRLPEKFAETLLSARTDL